MKRVTEYKYLKKILIRQKKIELVLLQIYTSKNTEQFFNHIFSDMFFYEIRTAVLGNVKCHIFLRKKTFVF